MGKYYYKKSKGNKLKKSLRLIAVLLLIFGIATISYVLFPIISWQIYFQPLAVSQNITPSVPRANLVELTKNSIDRTDYTRAENWFPKFSPNSPNHELQTNASFYNISIPKINIEKAVVATSNTDLSRHLVNYPGTGIPGKDGNAVIFGHSTLPQLFNPKDYKTIFANVYKLKTDDIIYVFINNVMYSYRIFKITIVDPQDSSALEQDFDNSYLTLVTCTPPGTTWKRLIVKARLEKI